MERAQESFERSLGSFLEEKTGVHFLITIRYKLWKEIMIFAVQLGKLFKKEIIKHMWLEDRVGDKC